MTQVMLKHSVYKSVPIVQAETLKKVFPSQNSQILLSTLTKNLFHSRISSSSLTQYTRALVCNFLFVFLQPLTHFFKGIPSETSLAKTFSLSLLLHCFLNKNKSLKRIK